MDADESEPKQAAASTINDALAMNDSRSGAREQASASSASIRVGHEQNDAQHNQSEAKHIDPPCDARPRRAVSELVNPLHS
jgi:hypothetical protein